MPTWRCPHCGTPQAEASRCWVCKRSSTSCATCRNFRRAVAGGLGYCGLDRGRSPLRGDEIRGCWEAAPIVEQPVARARNRPNPSTAGYDLPRRDFVPVGPDDARPRRSGAKRRRVSPAALPVDPLAGFWGDDR